MKNGKPPIRTKTERRYKAASVFCSGLGTFILLALIAICLPLTVPRLMGYEIYNVVSGSMEPTIPTGSIVYVTGAEPAGIEEGEVIAFYSGDAVVIHRVVENRLVEGEFVTKGDANRSTDIENPSYDSVLGTVAYHAPFLGNLSALYTSVVGKVYALGLAVVALMFYALGSRLKELSRPARDGGEPEEAYPKK